ncbi:hypothetical protein IPC451_28715 [Pseudomonas aeruginosa]|uniref:hypothetical protein n=1 Tax=Pseudomonas aeruginosa TaxID=287 RepID=UPI000F873C29|nr:hypothetical protein [Pseudomonas aeruginosa]RUH85810.1 hypothetical protein IPC451_28715 [Pseudomonas aeruginosa]
MLPAETAKFSLASPASIGNALSRASANFATDSFLGNANAYQVGVANLVKNLMSGASSPINDPELVESISVSSILHVYDGWSYLAQALRAAFRAEDSIARHLAYYAELRSSLSILACHGIGIYSHQHVVVDSSEQVHKLSTRGTHMIAWDALEEWSKTSHSGGLIGAEIQAFGQPLDSWIVSFQGTSTPSLVGIDWVTKWGIDLSSFSADRTTRNEVSYGVDFNHAKARHSPKSIEPWLRELWLSSEPGGSSFELLDKYLVRSTLEGIFEAKFKDPTHTPDQAKAALQEKMMETCIAMGAGSDEIIEFFMRDIFPDDLLVMQLAQSNSATHDPLQYQEVMSRAYLLLRLATASVRSLLRKASLTADDLAFWWVRTSEASGLWDSTLSVATTEEVKDLWADTAVSLEEFSDCVVRNPANSDSWFFFNSKIPTDLESLSRMEKVALWGIA